MNKSTYSIRKKFLKFFKSKNHKILKSSKLISKNDKTLLFTNSGMNQFKNIFLGLEKINYSRIATSQRCIRVGGKNNDLENVGKTTYHHTFFEMLGNFSFNDYFKFDAINYAWELLTSKNWFNLPKKNILVTVYASDNETFNIWKNNIKLNKKQIILIGDNKNIPFKSDNFWEMGVNYPCGPCTEIFYDKGNNFKGSLPGKKKKNKNERYIEIWNIVFMQFIYEYNKTIKPLSTLSIDTGMGLERISSIIQKVNSNYEIDLFKEIINKIKKISNYKNINKKSIYIIADHIRSSAFLILDGVIPSNDGRGYILRKIIRRAVLHGNNLGIKKIFFYKLIDNLTNIMEYKIYHLKKKKKQIKNIIKREEIKFLYTLKNGLHLLNLNLIKLKNNNINNNTLSGKIIFYLYDTYGFPFELIKEICNERGFKIDKFNFNILMNKQRLKSLNSNKFLIKNKKIINYNYLSILNKHKKINQKSKIIAIFYNSYLVNEIFYNDDAIIILNITSFYNKTKEQNGDQGLLINSNTIFFIYDTKKQGKTILHLGKIIKGKLKKNQTIKAIINNKYRINISKNHSATHLLYKSLVFLYGKNIIKKRTFANSKYLEFDFLNNYKIKTDEFNNIEKLVNKKIMLNLIIKIKKKKENKNIIKIGNFSKEICEGTHVKYTSEIGLFLIKSKYYVSNNILRIIAVTGNYALKIIQFRNNLIKKITKLLNTNNKNVNNILNNIYNKRKQNKKYNKYILKNIYFNLFKKINLFYGIKLIIIGIKIINFKLLINSLNNIKKKIDTSIIILIFKKKNIINLIIQITNDLIKFIKLNLIIKKVIKNFGGYGKINKNLLKIEINNIIILNKILKYILKKFKT
ncbi:MAG: alanine--tRNA ligase [Enterobacteriaceae bacterium PSpicST2]|nr:MAG: alanine--tRNA ligase [Enterobacteriaceae bacterium PSpicST2]WMC19115.1 MAG: alanine--tRNA ligase [Enterobacteriaceae bacterium PSpicST1]